MFNLSLNSAISIFINSQEKNLQLDFFRENQQVLLQIFKGYDVKNWKIAFESDNDDLILMIHFHKDKIDNKLNLERFKNSKWYNDFERVIMQGEVQYYLKSRTAHDSNILEIEIRELINIVYSLSFEKVAFTLNAY
ncbi:hypothetical protein LXD69_04785 [Flavobacterium sediminilitoris]|uniref:Uncharacterized protein n=1 Tax=Flavobacterium sediminilitoris TaxID=2024526 RepID=A0ABY4HPL5_9FLAO|nr:MULTISPECIES: hypothetical protein [Flavobacterium]UOX34827.1 hypothetical protein LXD69_04785 [Flavobacterium sediminilitoris]